MRFIPTRFHGILDYVAGLIFIIAPWIFNFSDVAYATWTIVAAGLLILLQTIFTDYEVGLVRKVPMRAHLLLELGLGLLLAISPWTLGFNGLVTMPHLVGGLFIVLAALTTHRVPSTALNPKRAHHEHRL